MKCKKCGASNTNGEVLFCSKCGAFLNDQSEIVFTDEEKTGLHTGRGGSYPNRFGDPEPEWRDAYKEEVREKRLQKVRRITVLCTVALILFVIAFCVIRYFLNTTIQISRVNGNVKLTGKFISDLTPSEGRHILNGSVVSTGINSDIRLRLDNGINAILSDESNAEFSRDRNGYHIRLNHGEVTFYTDITTHDAPPIIVETGTLSCYINDGFGHVTIDSDGRSAIYLLSGTADLTAWDPSLNLGKSGHIYSGQMAYTYAYNILETGEESYPCITNMKIADINSREAAILSNGTNMYTHVLKQTGWNQTDFYVQVESYKNSQN